MCMDELNIYDYITEAVFNKACDELKDGDSTIVYETENLKIKLRRRGKKIKQIFLIYGDRPFSECIQDLVSLQV